MWPGVCQSWVRIAWGKPAAMRLTSGTISSPPFTARLPPGTKQFWTSMTSSTSVPLGLIFCPPPWAADRKARPAVAVVSPVPAEAQAPDVEKARAEKKIVSYGQPDDWANWKEIWQVFCGRYGCTHEDTDMSSAEEISKFKAERANPVADSAEIG